MSETARNEYTEARNIQQIQNDARRIRTRVEAAQNNPARAGIRWPFELMQNAHDAGPRKEDSRVEVKFVLKGSNLEVSHNGMPFTAQELAALLSGGSSKEFDDEETTGRFGTGFMVTHCLSTRVDVSGIIKTVDGCEEFSINLDRAGNEESITDNIRKADIAIANAKPLLETEMDRSFTALFVYHDVNGDTVHKGLLRLEETIPYLYATCDKLGKVLIEREHETTIFEPSARDPITIEGFILKQTDITTSHDEDIRRFRAVQVAGKNSQSSLLIVLENTDDNQYQVMLPTLEFPKVFVKFPIAGTDFLPFKVVLDGRFAPQQERDGIAMHLEDRAIVKDALSALPTIVKYAVKSGWRNAHRLAELAVPARMLSGEKDRDEQAWWEENILEVAKATASKPIVVSKEGLLPALSDSGKNISFMVPAVTKDGHTPVNYNEIHNLASKVSGLSLPTKTIAQDWGQIATKWNDLGLPVFRFGLSELTEHVKGRSVENIPTKAPFNWLADLFLLVSDLPEDVSVAPIVSGLLPDQHSNLRRPRDLHIDGGIPEEIKAIAEVVGIDLRARLLHNDLMEVLFEQGYESAKGLVLSLLGEPDTKAAAIDEIIIEFDKRLPNDRKFDEESGLSTLRASASLAKYLLSEDDQRFRKCPLLTEDDTLVRLDSVQILAPVESWPTSYRPYANLYTGTRLLSNRYLTDGYLKESLTALRSSSPVFRNPLSVAYTQLSDANLLREMSLDNTDMAGVTVRNQSFGTIAFFASDLVNRCGNDRNFARLMLDFVLNVAAKEKQNWKETKLVTGSKSSKPVELRLYGAAWPFELKVRNWVPVPVGEKENGSLAQAPANEANLRELLDYSWLQNNPDGIELLHRVFGFKQLALMVENLDPEVETRLVTLLQDQELVKSAVENLDVLKAAVENPEAVRLLSEVGSDEIQQIRAEIQYRNQQAQMRERNRSFGYAVQAAVKEALESHGLDLVLVDKGFDYEVFPLEEALFSFTVGSYFLEVKATISRDVRLTPMQAETAYNHHDRFVLCVVDLHGEQIKDVWEPADVLPYARIVTNISSDVEKIYEGVEAFANSGNPVRLRNEQMLRYGISPELWYSGVSIEEWVQSLAR